MNVVKYCLVDILWSVIGWLPLATSVTSVDLRYYRSQRRPF